MARRRLDGAKPQRNRAFPLAAPAAGPTTAPFVIRKFTVEGKKGVDQAGTEVIGWDPHAKRLRSWVFDSNGGFGENMWVKDGNRWLMQYSGTLAVAAKHR